MPPNDQITLLEQRIAELERQMREHQHKGINDRQIDAADLFPSEAIIRANIANIVRSLIVETTGAIQLESGAALVLQSQGSTYINAGGGGAGSGDIFAHFDTETATGATRGFLYIPTVNGVPTGVPADAATGHAALLFDRAHDTLYIYNGGWKSVALS